MENDEIYWDFTEVNIQFRLKQHSCCHPSFKCSLCGLYKDNLLQEQTQKILELEDVIKRCLTRYEQIKFRKKKM